MASFLQKFSSRIFFSSQDCNKTQVCPYISVYCSLFQPRSFNLESWFIGKKQTTSWFIGKEQSIFTLWFVMIQETFNIKASYESKDRRGQTKTSKTLKIMKNNGLFINIYMAILIRKKSLVVIKILKYFKMLFQLTFSLPLFIKIKEILSITFEILHLETYQYVHPFHLVLVFLHQHPIYSFQYC